MPAIPAAPASDEATRLAALQELRVLDTLPELVYDDIVQLAAQICGTPIGLVSLVDSERQWFKARVGLAPQETHRDLAFCAHAIVSAGPVFVVEDTLQDARFRDSALVTGDPRIRFYAGAPIVMPGGQAMGTVCVIDTVPRTLDAFQLQALQALARQTTALLELRQRTFLAEQQSHAIERAAKLLQRMGALAKVGGWELDVETGKIDWTDEAYRIHEVDPATDPARLAHFDFHGPTAGAQVAAAVENAIRSGTPYDLELPFITARGRPKVVRTQGEALMRDGKVVRLFGTFQDITERRQAEAALLLTQQRLSLALSSSRLAVFDWDIAADRVYRGANLSVMRGGPAAEVVCTIEDARAQLHPADVLGVQAAIRAALRAEAPAYDFEHRIRRLDGGWVWIRAVGRVTERGPDGRALRISGIDEDVSARKAAERASLDSERRLRTLADNLPALIAFIDNDQRYRFLNAHIGRVFNIDPEAALGLTVREVRGEAVYAQVEPHVAAALRGEARTFAYTDEVDGRTYHYQSNYVPDIDAAGEINGFYAMTFDITELTQTQHQLELLARVDTLTGLANRRQFDERLADAMGRTRRTQGTMALMFLDIDHFKSINDSLGHAAGDEVLREFARRLKACVRATDTVARLAGDEFVVLLEGMADASELDQLADKVVSCIRLRFKVDGVLLDVTTSVGVAVSEGAGQTASEILSSADGALYLAKKQGRDRFVLA